MEKEFDSRPAWHKKCFKNNIKSYGDEVIDFHDKEISKADSNHNCLAVISLDSALKNYENCYLQVFSKRVLIHCKKGNKK